MQVEELEYERDAAELRRESEREISGLHPRSDESPAWKGRKTTGLNLYFREQVNERSEA